MNPRRPASPAEFFPKVALAVAVSILKPFIVIVQLAGAGAEQLGPYHFQTADDCVAAARLAGDLMPGGRAICQNAAGEILAEWIR